MTKRIPILCALVLLAAGTVAAIERVVEATVVEVSGSAVTIGVYNPESTAQTVRVQIAVLVSGGEEILTSANVTVGGGATSYVTLNATSTIVGIGDDPDPIMPSP
ncbi:MAG TPA: hypothetical protein VJ826_08995 [Candidatus Polarisedimenticolaceae bacterium]|nr:hypothetical protein [Candidatus Polarisedimenticolaceae bacterium]